MPQSDKATVVSQRIYDYLIEGRLILGLEEVYDGDEQLIPKTPSVCVIMGNKNRLLSGVPFRTDNTFEIFLMVYHGKIQDSQLNQRECMNLAEAIEDYLHLDKTMGDNVIHGYCTGIEPGALRLGNTMMFVSRITWSGLTKTLT